MFDERILLAALRHPALATSQILETGLMSEAAAETAVGTEPRRKGKLKDVH